MCKPIGRKADQHVARLDRPPVDNPRAVNEADDESGEVVLAVGVEARHLRRLAAYEGAPVFAAPARDAGNHLRSLIGQRGGRSPGSRERRAAGRLARGCRSHSG